MTVFASTARKFDAAKYFNTHPALLCRKHNRPTMEALQRGDFADIDPEEIAVSGGHFSFYLLKQLK